MSSEGEFAHCEECGGEYPALELQNFQVPRFIPVFYDDEAEDGEDSSDEESSSELAWVELRLCPECRLKELRHAMHSLKFWSGYSRDRMFKFGMPDEMGRHHYWTGASQVFSWAVRDTALAAKELVADE